MSTQYIQKKYAGTETSPTTILNDATGRAIIKSLAKAAGIAYDVATGFLKYNDADTIRTLVDLSAAQTLTNKTLTAPALTTPALTTPTGVVTALEAAIAQTTGDGTYTASFAVPAGATILDILVTNVVTWNAGTSATLKIGINGGDDDCFYTGVNLNSPTIAAGKSISFAFPGGVGGASIPAIDVGGEGGAAASSAIFLGATSGFLYKATAQQIDAIVAQTGTGANGRTRVTVLYSLPTAASVATKA